MHLLQQGPAPLDWTACWNAARRQTLLRCNVFNQPHKWFSDLLRTVSSPPYTRPEAWPIFDIDIQAAWIEPGALGARNHWLANKAAQLVPQFCGDVARRSG